MNSKKRKNNHIFRLVMLKLVFLHVASKSIRDIYIFCIHNLQKILGIIQIFFTVILYITLSSIYRSSRLKLHNIIIILLRRIFTIRASGPCGGDKFTIL